MVWDPSENPIDELTFMCPPSNDADRETIGPVVSMIGNIAYAEMRPVVDWISQRMRPQAQLWSVHSSIAEQLRSPEVIPDLIVVLQCSPDEYSRHDVHQLLAFAPLARVIVCAGAWCESESRNRDLWPQAVRLPIWASQGRLQQEWQLLLGSESFNPLLWSASREEIFACDMRSNAIHQHPQQVMLDSPDPAYVRFLREFVSAQGHQVVRTSPTLIVFDVDPWGAERIEALHAVQNQWPQAEVWIVSNEACPGWAIDFQESGIKQVRHKLGFGRQS